MYQKPPLSLDDDMSESSSGTVFSKDLWLVAQIISGPGMHEPWPHHYILFYINQKRNILRLYVPSIWFFSPFAHQSY
jgi:hypothetical protein